MTNETKEILIVGEEAQDKFFEMIQETKRDDLAVRISRKNYQTQLMFAARKTGRRMMLCRTQGISNCSWTLRPPPY